MSFKEELESTLEILKKDPMSIETIPVGTEETYNHVPIDVIYNELDIIFNGLWSWESETVFVFKTGKYLTNGKLTVTHPAYVSNPDMGLSIGRSIIRSGVGICASNDDGSPAISDALAFKNAARKLGNVFGRNLNRDDSSMYENIKKKTIN